MLNATACDQSLKKKFLRGSLDSGTGELSSETVATTPEIEALDTIECGSVNEPNKGENEMTVPKIWREHLTNTSLEEFEVPLCVTDVQRAAHKLNDPPTVFPSDNDSYHAVRRFLYITLTNEEWGIVDVCPVAIIATVKRWYGAGYYLRERYERGDLKDLCPLAAIKGIVDDPERICDMIAACIVQECHFHIERKMQEKKVNWEPKSIDADVNNWKGLECRGGLAYTRPKLPEEWTPQPRRSSSVYSRTSNGTLPAPIVHRTYSKDNDKDIPDVAETFAEKVSITGTSGHKEQSTLNQSSPRLESCMALMDSLRSRKEALHVDQASTKLSLALKRRNKSVQNLWNVFSKPNHLFTKSTSKLGSYECKTLRFEDAKGGPLPAIDDDEMKEQDYVAHSCTGTAATDDKSKSLGRSLHGRPIGTLEEKTLSPNLTEALIAEPDDVRYGFRASVSYSDFNGSRERNIKRSFLDQSKRMSWHLGDAASENGVLFPPSTTSSERLGPRSASLYADYERDRSHTSTIMDESVPGIIATEPKDITSSISELADASISNLALDDEPSSHRSPGLNLQHFLSQDNLNNPLPPPTSSVRTSRGQVILDTLQNFQKSMRRQTDPQTKVAVTEVEISATSSPAASKSHQKSFGASHGPIQSARDSPEDALWRMRGLGQENTTSAPAKKTSMPRKLGRGLANALRPLKPARFR
ncbi:hypothetical protein BDV96DRAFT_640548 [Lophiotrema nucula]|uniref:Uncharacterized protein n=1 Tax=Lophiotrema nucula TaxID=690887 RepID=A0A6A5ZPI4_9PLEO|nr:hypothetical protein BDV96DRAFT_640548 [Lophiotrema nucula]